MKRLLEILIKRKASSFKLDYSISYNAVLSELWTMYMVWMRSFRMYFYFLKRKGIKLGRKVQFHAIRDIKFGNNNLIGDYSYIRALGKNSLIFGENSGVGDFCKVITSTQINNISGFIKLGNNVWIGDDSNLGGAGGLEIGDDTFTGQRLYCHPENHMFEATGVLYREQGVTRKGIKIGKNCWIGSNVTITDGVIIGNNCVVAAGAVLTKPFPDNSLIGGVPAKLIKEIPQSEKENRNNKGESINLI